MVNHDTGRSPREGKAPAIAPPETCPDSISLTTDAGSTQHEMGFTQGMGVSRPLGAWVRVLPWNAQEFARQLRELRGREAWWAPCRFDGSPRRAQLEQALRALPPDTSDARREELQKELARAVANYRSQDNFVVACVLAADLDFHDADGQHVAPPDEVSERLLLLMREGALSGNLGHLTPRGGRVMALLPWPVTDGPLCLSALRGLLETLRLVLDQHDLLDKGAGGYRLDPACVELARQFFAPNADGRNADVIVWSGSRLEAGVWAECAPPEPAPFVATGTPQHAEDMQNQREKLLWLAKECELFHDGTGRAYARLPGQLGSACFALDSTDFGDWLRCEAMERLRLTATSSLLSEVVATLQATARVHGDLRDVFLRVGQHDDKLYLDLGGPAWRCVEMSAGGWRILDEVPVLFRRAPGMLEIPEPVTGGDLRRLRAFVNGDDDAFHLVLAQLLCSLHPGIGYPVLLVHGEEGSAKSTLLRIIKKLVDPHVVELARPPSDARDLAIAAEHSWILSFDNMSKMSQDMSDAICCLSTGGAFTTRELYTNRGQSIFSARRPVMLNGISQFAHQGDLLNRASFLELDHIPEDRRKSERTLWLEFDPLRPQLLGALLDAVCAGLRCLPQIDLPNPARLADAAELLTAVETGMGWPVGRFNRLLQTSGDRGIHDAIEADAVLSETISLLNEEDEWRGRPGVLLNTLRGRASEEDRKQLPKRPNAVTKALKKAARIFRRLGWDMRCGIRDTNGDRIIEFRRRT